MILRSTLFKRVTIVGVGLMGGSLGMALKKHRLVKEVVGLSHRQSSLTDALKVKAIDKAETDIQKGVKNSDLIVMATPVESIVKLLMNIAPYIKRGAIVTDVGSAKTEIVEFAEKKLQQPNLFVGSHPLVGSEKKGVENSSAELFQNGRCLMTPTKNTHRGAVDKIKKMWTKIGANVSIITCQEHDEILSYTSHLPHLLAFGLMEIVPEKCLPYASSGLRDTTRIASSSAQLWNDICMSNAKNVVNALDQYVNQLAHLRQAIVDTDRKKLVEHFTKAQEKRNELFKS